MLKIALTGGTGLVGSRIIEVLSPYFEFTNLSQEKLDITNNEKVCQVLENLDYDIFLHLAAYTNVDGAEKNKDLAFQVNVTGTKNLLQKVISQEKKFIYISTDFVFDGTTPPYSENDTPNPLNYYSQTKFQGEQVTKDKAMIIRISYPYRTKFLGKKDLVCSLKNRLEKNEPLIMINDSLITPTFIDDIAFGMKHLFVNYDTGIYHLVGGDSISPFTAGQTIAEVFGLNKNLIKPISFCEYFKDLSKVNRPKFSQIISTTNAFYKMMNFKEGLIEIKKQLTETSIH